MDPEQWQRVKAVVADALECDSAQRGTFVSTACGGDAGLLREVQSILAQAGDRLDACADGLAESRLGDVREGQRIGAYEIVRETARGGMGAVYLARRADREFEKEVAIKILKRGTDTDEVSRRFRAERQILARLEHPNIARLIDAGTTADGLPYFVMEYVDGTRITDYCLTNGLTVRRRIALFLKVCGAVHFAHTNLVVHRDLKPANILIKPDGEPKLLDFGIAKLLSGDAGTIEVTAVEQQRLTPAYASPEQVRGEPITTASDVYSLGALLYQLLTGQPPHRFRTPVPSSTELLHVIGVQEPPRPSSLAGRPEIARELKGDLDNILATALRKEPERRYPGVTAFADDLGRFLDGRPVRARTDTAAYRASKFIQRHKVGVAAAVAVLITLVGGVAATAWQARRAELERGRAERRFNDVRKLAHAVLFDYHDPIALLPGSTAVRERLVKDALEYLDGLSAEAGDDRDLLSELGTAYEKVARVQGNSYYANLGNTDGALKSYRRSVEIRQQLLALEPRNPEFQDQAAESYEGIADVLYSIGDLLAGLRSYGQALELRERLIVAVPENVTYRIALAGVHEKIGDIKGMENYANLGDTAGALASCRKAQEILEPLYNADPHDLELISRFSNVLTHVGMLARTTGDVPAALEAERRAVGMLEAAAQQNPNSRSLQIELLAAKNLLRYALEDNGQFAEAIDQSRQLIAELQKLLAADPKNSNLRRNLAVTHNMLGKNLLVIGDIPGALENHGVALAISEEMLAATPNADERTSDVAFTMQRLGQAQAAGGEYEAAAKSYDRALKLRQAAVTADPSNIRARDDVSSLYSDIASALDATGEYDRAIESAMNAIPLAEEVSAKAPTNARARATLARRYSELGKLHLRAAGERKDRVHLTTARDLLGRSLAIWKELDAGGKVIPSEKTRQDEVGTALADCEAALAQAPQT